MKGWAGIIATILLAIVGIIVIISVYGILYYLKILIVILAGIITFFYAYKFINDFKIHKWINFGLSFLISCGVIVFIYNSWVYIATLLLIYGVIYFIFETKGINIIKQSFKLLKQLEGGKK